MEYILKTEIKEYSNKNCYGTKTYEIKGNVTFRDILNKFDMYECYKSINIYYSVKSNDTLDPIFKHFINKVDDKFIEEHQNDKVSNINLLINKINDTITSIDFGIVYIYYNQDN
jgi:hypothetical protein